MSNYLNIPLCLPFKFVPNTSTPGLHFDDDWACKQIRSNERRVYYRQKWMRAYTTKLQIVSTIEPQSLKLYNTAGSVVKSFTWNVVAVGPGSENAYECTVDFTDVATDGVYYLYQKNELLSVKFEAISEPIHLKDYHPYVRVWKYSHSRNEFGMIWSTGIQMTFMCESDIPASDYSFERDRNAFVDQVHNVSTLSAFPWRQGKLHIGTSRGVAPYIMDIANRITCCDNWKWENEHMEVAEGAKWEMNRVKGYPLVAGSIDVLPAKNKTVLQLNSEDPIAPGFVTAYTIDQGFFGTANIVHITDFEQS